MTISSSLNAGVMGLNVNATRLASISDNIANSATYGYKRTEVDFNSMVVNQQQNRYSAGGVSATSYKEVDSQGSLISTGNALDIAISGRGMIPVTDVFGVDSVPEERDLMLTPTGGFFPDENGDLRTLSGLFLLGWPAGTDDVIQSGSRDSASSLVPVNVDVAQFSAAPTRNISLGLNLPAASTQAGGTGESFSLPIEYYDNLGTGQELTFNFTPVVAAAGSTASNTWNVTAFDAAGDPTVAVASFTADFNTDAANGGSLSNIVAGAGTTYDPLTGELDFAVSSGPMSTFVGRPGESSGLTQLAATFTPSNVTKDGSPIGDLQSVEINDEGFVEAIYTTGFRRTIYQVPVADVPNLNGLTAINNQAYSVSAESGDLYFWDAGSGPVGSYSGYALMESNTDIASELTSLIETQRAYSSNAKIIQTVDEMLQETTNLKR